MVALIKKNLNTLSQINYLIEVLKLIIPEITFKILSKISVEISLDSEIYIINVPGTYKNE